MVVGGGGAEVEITGSELLDVGAPERRGAVD
jgi:hypothetical protein